MFHLTLWYSPQINYNLNQILDNECKCKWHEGRWQDYVWKWMKNSYFLSIILDSRFTPSFGPLFSTAQLSMHGPVISSKFPYVSNLALTWNRISTKTQLWLRLCYVTWFLSLKICATEQNVSLKNIVNFCLASQVPTSQCKLPLLQGEKGGKADVKIIRATVWRCGVYILWWSVAVCLSSLSDVIDSGSLRASVNTG